MNKPTGPLQDKATLLERASGLYDFGDALRGHVAPPIDAGSLPPPPPVTQSDGPTSAPVAHPWSGPIEAVDRLALAEAGYVLPDGPVTGIGEEFRIVKRQLLSSVAAGDNRVLVCSALPGDGKTFCAVNLALSLAAGGGDGIV